jgi:methylamine dehydrogenase heavy chain
MSTRKLLAVFAALIVSSTHAQPWDSIVGTVSDVGEPSSHWFTVRGRNTAYVIDGDAGEVKGTLTLSMFTPAIRPQMSRDRVYAYGSFYTRTYYGDRTDLLIVFDASSMQPIKEIEIPSKAAGIGHSGMIGLIDERFIGVWNITPATSVSLIDIESDEFVGEISTPGCAAVYPVGMGFLMPCGSGALQYIMLEADGETGDRVASETFFDVDEDPVFDYAVPTAEGWMFMSLEGLVFEATIDDGQVTISEPWSIIDGDDPKDEGWRIGGRQPFAFNPATGTLVTLMHEGGGQETFEDAGTEVWAFNAAAKRRGYRLELEAPARGLQLTTDAEPLMLVSPDDDADFTIHNALTGRKLREMGNISGLIQPLMETMP